MKKDLKGVFFRPFTHDVGKRALLSGSNSVVRVYPTQLICLLMSDPEYKQTCLFNFPSQVVEFQLMQDLKRDMLRVSGSVNEGFFSYTIKAVTGGIELKFTSLKGSLSVEVVGQGRMDVKQGQRLMIAVPLTKSDFNSSAMFHMGCFKKQHWESVTQRFSLQEILPYFFTLGKKYPGCASWDTYAVEDKNPLSDLQAAIANREKLPLKALFLQMYRMCFRDLLVPCFSEDHYWGESVHPYFHKKEVHFLSLLYQLTRSLFVQWDKDRLTLLPLLPRECLSGHIQELDLNASLTLSFRWSKARLFFVSIKAKQACRFSINTSGYSRGYRLRNQLKEKGERKLDEVFTMASGEQIFLDRWEV